MDMHDYIKFVAAFCLVLGMMGGLAMILKKIGLGNIGMIPNDKRRLKIVEILQLDARRKAVLIRRDNTDHLVILSSSGETVVETNIPVETKLNSDA